MSKLETGFTMVELVIVMVIIGILSSVGISRFASADRFEARGFIDDSLITLNHARLLASSTGCHIRVQSSATALTISRWADCQPASHDTTTVAVKHPNSQGDLALTAPTGIILNSHDFYFNSAGVPFDRATETAFTTVTSLNISSSLGTDTISVEPETGFLHH